MRRSVASLIALRRILRTTELHGKALGRVAGLTPVQLQVLKVIEAAGETTPKAIAGELHVAQATVTALLDRLAVKNLLCRTRGTADRRQVMVTLTDGGRAAIDAAPDPLQARFTERFETLPDWEQGMIVAALERVAALMNAADLESGALLDHAEIGADIGPDPDADAPRRAG